MYNLFLLLILPLTCFSNSNTDSSDVKKLNTLYKEINNSNASEKNYLHLLLKADSLSCLLKDTESLAEINSRIGSYYFQRDADKAIRHLIVAAKNYRLNNNKPFLAFCFLNIASAYDEKKQDFIYSSLYLDSAIIIWKDIGDLRNEANLHKYKGLVLAKQSRIKEGKEEAFLAIQQFNSISYKHGIAVSYFDLAKIFEINTELDSAISYITKAIVFWKAEKDTFRIITNMNFLLNLYLKKTDLKEAGALQAQISNLVNHEIHWQALLNFYYLSENYFNKNRLLKKEKDYHSLYMELQNNLNDKHIKAFSEYKL